MNFQTKQQRFDLMLWLPSLIVGIILSGAVHFVANTERQRLAQDLLTTVSWEVNQVISRLEAEINADVFLVNGLIAHVMVLETIDEQRIKQALEVLYGLGRHIRNIGVAPDNRITHVYPLEGNEAAIGLYYPDVPNQWPAVERAMTSRQTVLGGPLPLLQGGRGLISRTPVFLNDDSYWGMISLVLDFDRILEAVVLNEQHEEIQFALRGRDGKGSAGEVFFGAPELFDSDALLRPINIPNGTWQLAARPVTGWQPTNLVLLGLEIFGFFLCALLAVLLWGYRLKRRQVIFSERRLRTIVSTTQDCVIVIDEQGMVQEFNPAAEKMFGYRADEVIGSSIKHLMPNDDARHHDQHVRSSSIPNDRSRKMGERQIFGRRSDGSLVPLEITVGHAEFAKQRLFVGIVRDITERKQAEERLVKLATTDSLTGILNRGAFLRHAEEAFQLAQRHQRELTLLLLDADHFKRVNDTYGHQIGDEVLKMLVAQVQHSLRQTDHFGRFGGEEFILLLPETGLEQAQEVCTRMLNAIRTAEVPDANGGMIQFTVSVGIATRSAETQTLDGMIANADAALYQAKQQGRDRFCVA